MIILIPLLVAAFAFWALKWAWNHFNLPARLSATAVGAGWAGYGIIGALIPHTDPQLWHYASAPAVGILVLVLGWTLINARGAL